MTQLIDEAAREVLFMSAGEVRARLESEAPDLVLLDMRERDAFESEHLPGARHVPRGELELRVDQELPDPTVRVLTYCQDGTISTLAAATLRTLGYTRAIALDGGLDAWVRGDYPVERGIPGDSAFETRHVETHAPQPGVSAQGLEPGTVPGNEGNSTECDGRWGAVANHAVNPPLFLKLWRW